MSDQNSTTEMQYRPEEVQSLLSIKSAAYYERTKFLKIKANKDEEGKAYLTSEQFEQLKQLGEHIQKTGKMEGFTNQNSSELAVSNSASIETTTAPNVEEPTIENDLGKQIFRKAAELKASELAMMPAIVREVANRMTKDDLPEDLKVKVEQTEEATRPNFQPGAIADRLIDQFRQNREQLA